MLYRYMKTDNDAIVKGATCNDRMSKGAITLIAECSQFYETDRKSMRSTQHGAGPRVVNPKAQAPKKASPDPRPVSSSCTAVT
jgi:hypothetical protein